MSQWTHINASIRFDGIQGTELLPTEKELGKICRWGDKDDSHWENPDLPCGSEGSLEYKIILNPDQNSLAAMVVVFYGDLRDYDDVDEIIDYFNKIVKNKSIRSGILEIDLEYENILIYQFDESSKTWKKIYRNNESK